MLQYRAIKSLFAKNKETLICQLLLNLFLKFKDSFVDFRKQPHKTKRSFKYIQIIFTPNHALNNGLISMQKPKCYEND